MKTVSHRKVALPGPREEWGKVDFGVMGLNQPKTHT
jgi:hypothetical protein